MSVTIAMYLKRYASAATFVVVSGVSRDTAGPEKIVVYLFYIHLKL